MCGRDEIAGGGVRVLLAGQQGPPLDKIIFVDLTKWRQVQRVSQMRL